MTPLPTARPARRPALAAALLATVLAAVVQPAAGATPLETVVVSSVDGAVAAAQAVRAAGGRVVASLPLVGGVVARLPRAADPGSGTTVVPDIALHAAGAQSPSTPASTSRATLGLAHSPADGDGVGVALVDTGIADVPALAGKVAARVNTSDGPAGDGYGHGTFLAGLVAGDGVGVAPAAHLVDVQVADAAGETSLSRVLRGLQAVSDLADEHDVRVVNLSLSSGSPLPPSIDPLARAVAMLVRQGLVVVVAAGNEGPQAGTVTSPGNAPDALTVGALDEAGTSRRADDGVAGWSSRGSGRSGKPELVAPGVSVLSLRAPGSIIDTTNPAARAGQEHFRGSGTSMAAAVASGAVAVLLAERPALTPSAVRSLLTGTAYAGSGLRERSAAGAGGLDAGAALAAPVGRTPRAAHRGSDAAGWETLGRSWVGRAWAGRAWAGRAWAGRAWADEDWAGRAWADEDWAGRAWADEDWADEEWAARAWSARAWSARAWSARAWSARAWG